MNSDHITGHRARFNKNPVQGHENLQLTGNVTFDHNQTLYIHDFLATEASDNRTDIIGNRKS